jgi:lipase maturation factor 1
MTDDGVVSRWLFLRLLAAVYLVAFSSVAVQITGLVGPHGLMPAGGYLEWAHSVYGREAYRLLPTIFWLGAGNLALRLAAWGGAALGLLLILGVAPMLSLGILWLLYLSLVVAGQDFLSFQWDALLLEAGLLALLWAPAQWLPGRTERRPAPLARALLVFLLFKLMLLSGATKLLSGDPTWRHATALDFHFETQPLPPWTAWYAHHLPGPVHRALTLFTFVVELGAPWLLLLPSRFRSARLAGVATIVLLQLGIAATGNFGFFNALTVVLCVPVLDDRVLGVLPVRLAVAGEESQARRTVIAVVAPLLLLLSALSFARELTFTVPAARGERYFPRPAARLLGWVDPLRSVNGYGLFRVMTTERPELIIEGSSDGRHWLEYGFRYKPGDVDRRPPFVAPFHPRLDWQMWFAALAPMASAEWLQTLSARIRAGTPEVLALLGRNPFPDAPPRFVRAVQYGYRFSTVEEQRRTGAWWVRELVGYLPLGPEPEEHPP